MKKRTGYLFRRKNGRHINIDDPAHQNAKIYLCYMVNYERKTKALGTIDKRVAEVKAAKLMGGMAYSDHEGYLIHLIEMGEMAKRELGNEQSKRIQTKVSEVWPNYMASKERPNSGEKTLNHYKSIWNRFSKWLPRSIINIEDVTKPTCSDYIDNLEASGSKYSTCTKHLFTLKLIFKTISSEPSPWIGLRIMMEDDAVPHRLLSPDECGRLFHRANGEYKTLIFLGYSTGLRLIDCINLKWKDVDMKERVAKVIPSKTKKKKKAALRIPITTALHKHLNKLPKSSTYVMPQIHEAYNRRSTTPTDKLNELFAKAQVINSEEGTASFHSLRVTFQSLNDNAGTSRVITRSITGHSSAKMSDTYSRLDVERAREALEKAIPAL